MLNKIRVPRKPLISAGLRKLPPAALCLSLSLLVAASEVWSSAAPVPGDPDPSAPARFLGQPSCSSSSCHGGAGDKRGQCLSFDKLDFHSIRPYATLTTRRSAVLAESLQIKDPTTSARCTVCHAPFQNVPAERRSPAIDPTRGLSCETCHGPAENWLRSHTRGDFSHQDRIQAGMRDLQNPYVRANTCVACHQNVDGDLLRAGHPELIFELDGQAVTQPKHWHEPAGWSGAKAWAVGQAAALREMSWQLSREKTPPESLPQRWAGLAWVLQHAGLAAGPATAGLEPSADNFATVQKWADALATNTAAAEWKTEHTLASLKALASASTAFRAKDTPQPLQARRAERLALAVDRLVIGLGDKAIADRAEPVITRLFQSTQSLPGFDSDKFAGQLEELQKALGN